MFLKKVLNQPNLVGTVMIALMVCSGFVYAFAFDGFNVETATGGEVEAWLAAAGGGSSGDDPDLCDCMSAYMIYDGCSVNLCKSDGACGNNKASCSDECIGKSGNTPGSSGCDECGVYEDDEGIQNLYCKNNGELCTDPEKCTPVMGPPDDGIGPDANDRGGW